MRNLRCAVAIATASAALAVALASPGPAAATTVAPTITASTSEASAELVRTVTYNGTTITLRLHPNVLRSSQFEVLVQQPDGSLVEQQVGAERAWLGTVDGSSSAVVSGIVQSDGRFHGLVVFDRGATWEVTDTAPGASTATVTGTRGVGVQPAYHWPSSTTADRNQTVAPGQSQGATFQFVLGYDLANNWFTNGANPGGSVARALDDVEFEVAAMYPLYEGDALLRPALGRVVVRADPAHDPYAVNSDLLGKTRTEWMTNQADAGVDDVVLRHSYSGGGVAWVGSAGTSYGVAVVGGAGAGQVVTRHEVGHNWGAHDNHTNGPEGPTVNSGNQLHRWDGTELRAILSYRNGHTSSFTPVPAEGAPLPPYAALDLSTGVKATVPFRFAPTANDFDANGETVSLASVAATSNLGGTVTRSGDTVTYTPPAVSSSDTFDYVTYVARDTSGRTATGVAMFRVDPYTLPDPSTWSAATVTSGQTWALTNRQTDGSIAPMDPTAQITPLVQQANGGTDLARWTVTADGGGYRIVNRATKGCVTLLGADSKPTPYVAKTKPCYASSTRQRVRLLAYPTGGVALVNPDNGRCVAPTNGSMGATLVEEPCGTSPTEAWEMVGYDPPA